MKPMLFAFLAIALLAIGTNFALKQAGFGTSDRAAGGAVRLD